VDHFRAFVALVALPIIVTSACTGPRPFRRSLPQQEVSVLGADPQYAAVISRAPVAPRALTSVNESYSLNTLPEPLRDTPLPAFPEGAYTLLRDAYAVDNYPVFIDSARVPPTSTAPLTGRELAVGDAKFDIVGRTVTTSFDKVTLGARQGELHTEPVNFDIGGGIGVLTNTSGATNNDVMGVFAAVRGYPFGGWYAMSKSGTGSDTIYEYTTVPEATFWNRLSLSFGISNSIGNEKIQDPALFVGLGVDVSPQLAFVAGVSWFELDDSLASGNNQTGFFLGTTLSLRAIADLLALKTGGFTNQ
jgi:hypothetical protein